MEMEKQRLLPELEELGEEKAAAIPEPSILKLIVNDSDARWNGTD